jgi:hypothetical protein
MADNITVLNTIWENGSDDYQTRVPLATQDNITAVGNAILTYGATTNEFLDSLVNRISLVLVSSKMAQNKLSIFKKGMLEFGSDIEEIFTSMAQAHTFNVTTSEDEVFRRETPDVRSIFHRVNREDFYKTTIEEGQIKRAFLNNDGLGKLVTSIMESLYSGDNHDEYILMKELVSDYDPFFKAVEVPKVVDQGTAQDFFRAVKQTSTDMTFMTDNFNAQGVMNRSDKNEQVLLLHKNVDTYLNVDLLSWVFNAKNMDFETQVVILDDFGTLGNVQACLVDKDWFMVYDKLFQSTSQYNAQGLYWNYWLHHHQLLSTSQFQNAVKFVIPGTTGTV